MTEPLSKNPRAKLSYLRDNEELRTAIKWRMKFRNLSSYDLADMIGYHQTHVSRYLRGKRPSLSDFYILSLANVLNVKVSLNVELT